MIEIISCKNPIYAFGKENVPIKTINPGSRITVETYDALGNQVKNQDTQIDHLDWGRVNPATGPIFIEDAEPGDILKVKIENIEVGEQGVMLTGKGFGVLGDRLNGFDIKIVPILEQAAIFDERLSIPLNPMIGVIGVAPQGDPVPCGVPGSHGGNMDTKIIAAGATLYLPVFVKGALFALGDLHAAMGDGEISVTGIEVPGKVTIQIDLIKNRNLPNPMLENSDGIAIIASAATLDEAVKTAVVQMVDFLLDRTDLTLSHLTMLLSLLGDVQVSQVVDPLVTARFFVSRNFLEAYNVSLF